ncbi:MAG: T9SS type A sorting domain-containing protein [Bacteroidetes bacterium]|nr:T9SS type A sorting domain-containing protein [Bacteroidota bacterium]
MKRFLLLLTTCFIFLHSTQAQSINTIDALCFGQCDGAAFLTPTGAAAFFQWSNGDTAQNPINLCAGTYDVTILDNGYLPLDTLTATILEPSMINFGFTMTNVSCFGGFDGSVVLNANGGTPPYSYNWSNGMTGAFGFNLNAGNYFVTITDMNGCTATNVFGVAQPNPIAIALLDSASTTCASCDGSAHSVATGGSSPYTFIWSNGATTQTLTSLCVGTYTLTLVDANGCSASASSSISAPTTLSATQISNHIDCDHPVSNAVLTINNGIAPYYISWGDGTQDSSQLSNVLNHVYVTEGVYDILYNDGSGCGSYILDTIFNNGLVVSIGVIQQPTCVGTNIGRLKAYPAQGSPPYFFLWSTGSTADSTSNLSSGNYSLTVTDSTGCMTTTSYYLNDVSSLTANAIGTSASCINSNMGSAMIYVNGGTPGYTYLWGTAPPQTTQVATNIAPGHYGFTVTDAVGCMVANTANIAFTSYSFYTYISLTAPSNCGISNGSLDAYPSGGTPPYTYLWSNNQTTQTASGLGVGNYTVTVTDAGGCSSTGTTYLSSTCYNTISGNIFNDANGNCIYDSADTNLSGYYVSATNGNITEWGSAWSGGHYTILVHDTGTFTVTLHNYSYGSCGNLTPCGNVNPVHFGSFNNVSSNNNFGFSSAAGFDLALHPGWTSANPGFSKDYWIFYYNQSYTPFTGNATVSFQYDANLTYNSCDPPLPTHNLATRTLSWVVNGVSSWDLRGHCHFTVSPSTPAGYHLQSDFWITPTAGDCDSSNNHQHYAELVASSMDPNEKEVEPAGAILEEDSVLTYTIHFQNTGTDTTWFVILKDTLDANLDVASVRNLASSHTYSEFNISGKGILTWVFNPVFLVDSATNEQASKAFVKFSVKKKSNLPVGTRISNSASIVFDYNSPILTNTVTDTVSEPNYIFQIRGMENVSVTAVPNPFSTSTTITVDGLKEKFDFSLFDVTGRMLNSITSIETKQFELRRDAIPAGVYFYKLSTSEKKVANGKLIVE